MGGSRCDGGSPPPSATRTPRLESRGGTPVATDGPDALAVCSWDAGEAHIDEEAIFGRFEAREGCSALIVLCAAHQEPLVFPRRGDVEGRLEATSTYWRRWAGQRAYSGPWRDAVIRSALALKLLVHAPSRRSRRRRAPPCQRRSAASATGTASVGCVTRPSRLARCWSSAAQVRARRSSGGCSTLHSSPTRAFRCCTG